MNLAASVAADWAHAQIVDMNATTRPLLDDCWHTALTDCCNDLVKGDFCHSPSTCHAHAFTYALRKSCSKFLSVISGHTAPSLSLGYACLRSRVDRRSQRTDERSLKSTSIGGDGLLQWHVASYNIWAYQWQWNGFASL
jgi:hypothetical protein